MIVLQRVLSRAVRGGRGCRGGARGGGAGAAVVPPLQVSHEDQWGDFVTESWRRRSAAGRGGVLTTL